jgi:glycosyltransferase involved in cell wall biosynthesis
MTEGLAVVVPALNEAEDILELLEDLARQHPAPDEVIVVDAGSTDGTRQLVERTAARRPGLRLWHLDGALPGHARNEGIRRCGCELIATVDAGTRVPPDWLGNLSAPLRTGGGEAVSVGIAVADARSSFERAAGWFTLRAFKPPARRPPLTSKFRPAGRNGLCFRRASWVAVGGYPEDLRWGEDKVFIQRLRRAGLELIPVPEATVRWRPRQSLREFFRQYRGYGYGDAVAGVDRQNELITLGLYAAGAVLSAFALAGTELALLALAVMSIGYLGLFTLAAWRELGAAPALAWVPVIRITADLAKMGGFLAGYGSRLRRR